MLNKGSVLSKTALEMNISPRTNDSYLEVEFDAI